ncbi:unknown similar to AMEV250 [Choristoneura biennis entomopoxvirus]|uniref:Uncharacterized protein n=1 Tax=Choristoneura biennis entomopoxvirus TaxID=10288 RepID=A0A916KQ90_CBEPV|nr:unknown similar to AMEV250 [Choristoneura biennis entomopoxvirus]CCU55855.1 unknown similar to AMEV250 [Choristoneura biennis entomopoxvirus]
MNDLIYVNMINYTKDNDLDINIRKSLSSDDIYKTMTSKDLFNNINYKTNSNQIYASIDNSNNEIFTRKNDYASYQTIIFDNCECHCNKCCCKKNNITDYTENIEILYIENRGIIKRFLDFILLRTCR